MHAPAITDLPLVALAQAWWAHSTGRGAYETAPVFAPDRFGRMLESPFGTAPRVVRTRSFRLPVGAHGLDHVDVHTTGRAPSCVTYRTIRATVAVLEAAYGPYPGAQARVDVFLVDDARPKSLPAPHTPVTVHHINSGFSTNEGSARRVVVLRCSEMHRTLVHEFIHVWGAHGRDNAAAQAQAASWLGAPRGCLLTESFVEAVTWLIHGGFCPGGLDPDQALWTARAFLDGGDTGTTNGWAYFVGKAMLIADGGHAFHATFFQASLGYRFGRRLDSARAHADLVAIMRDARDIPAHPAGTRRGPVPVTLCPCKLGTPFLPVGR